MQGPDTQRLYLGKTMLEDARQLADLKVENDDVLALTYQQSGGYTDTWKCSQTPQTCLCNRHTFDADGSWEDVNIAEYVPDMEGTVHS